MSDLINKRPILVKNINLFINLTVLDYITTLDLFKKL